DLFRNHAARLLVAAPFGNVAVDVRDGDELSGRIENRRRTDPDLALPARLGAAHHLETLECARNDLVAVFADPLRPASGIDDLERPADHLLGPVPVEPF